MKEILENWNKYILSESGLSRLYDHMMEHDSAVLTAFRNEYSNKENYEKK